MAWTEELPPDKNGVVKVRGFYRLADGRKRSKTFTHAKAAFNWAAGQEQKVAEGSSRDPSKGRMRWGDWCDVWWPTRTLEPGGSQRSQDTLRDLYVKPRWGKVPLRDIDSLAVQTWVNQLHKKKGLAASTTQQCYYMLSVSLKEAIRAKLIDHTPCTQIILPTLPLAPERYFTPEEVQLLIANLKGESAFLATLMVESGLRVGEALGLHWQRVDMERKTIDVIEKWVMDTKSVGAYPKGRSTRRRRRTVPISNELHGLLKARRPAKLEKCGFEHQLGSTCRSQLVVGQTRMGTVIDPRYFAYPVFKRALERAELGDARPHDLRHTFASRLIDAGVDILRVQYLLGHAHLATTQRYVHLRDVDHDEVRAALAKSWQSAPKLPLDLGEAS